MNKTAWFLWTASFILLGGLGFLLGHEMVRKQQRGDDLRATRAHYDSMVGWLRVAAPPAERPAVYPALGLERGSAVHRVARSTVRFGPIAPGAEASPETEAVGR